MAPDKNVWPLKTLITTDTIGEPMAVEFLTELEDFNALQMYTF